MITVQNWFTYGSIVNTIHTISCRWAKHLNVCNSYMYNHTSLHSNCEQHYASLQILPCLQLFMNQRYSGQVIFYCQKTVILEGFEDSSMFYQETLAVYWF